MKNNKLLITGCAGFIGMHLCKSMLSDGYTILGIDNITLYNCNKTVFKNITQLPQGRLIEVNIKDCNKKIIRWDFPLKKLPKISSGFKENTNDYYELLYNATLLRTNSDVKTGTSLSLKLSMINSDFEIPFFFKE